MTGGPEPSIGWFVLSEADRRTALRHLEAQAIDGTRDELGFGQIHFAYSDRFFPGTSVLHGHLRYVFFVAWSYEELRQRTAGTRFPEEELRTIEERFSRRLMSSVPALLNSGIAGWMRYRAGVRPRVRASQIYWNALKTWGILERNGSERAPNEGEIWQNWQNLVSYDEGEESKPTTRPLFSKLPAPPVRWLSKDGRLDFTLTKVEAAYILDQWRTAAGSGRPPPLLSKLGDARVAPKTMWSGKVAHFADATERTSLVFAYRAAALVCVARALYNLLVERSRNSDTQAKSDFHAKSLPQILARYREPCLALDLPALQADARLDISLVVFLERVQAWVRDESDPETMRHLVAEREHSLKDGRGFLVSADRRLDWKQGAARPLDYRWPVIHTLLTDLLEAA